VLAHQFKPSEGRRAQVGWRFQQLDAAKEWGLTPMQFDALGAQEQGEMVGFIWASRTVEAYHYETAKQAAERKSPRR